MPTDLPRGLMSPLPVIEHQPCLFRLSLADALAGLGVSPDDLRRWHDRGWISFDGKMDEMLGEYDDPKVFEIQIVRDIVRSGLTDAQIEVLLAGLPKPFAFDPDRLVYSFRHGWVQVVPPAEAPSPAEIIDDHFDEWLVNFDEEALIGLRDKISEALRMCVEREQET